VGQREEGSEEVKHQRGGRGVEVERLEEEMNNSFRISVIS
jgi:hypothetical protein